MQRDVVLRWIEQIVTTVRRMLLGPGGVDPAAAEQIIDEAIVQLLGPLALLVPQLEAGSAAVLLHDRERILGYAQLLQVKAMVLDRRGLADAAARTRERAAALEHEALACPECGAVYTDPAESCASRFQRLLGLDHSRTEPWGSRHGVVFSCYTLQHPADQPRKLLERVWLALHRLVVEGDDPVRLFQGLRRDVAVAPADWNAPPLPETPAPGGPYRITIADLGDFAPADYHSRVDQWARATYERWASTRAG